MEKLYTCKDIQNLERKRIAGTSERLVCHDLGRRWARVHDLAKIGPQGGFTDEDYRDFVSRDTKPGRKKGWNLK